MVRAPAQVMHSVLEDREKVTEPSLPAIGFGLNQSINSVIRVLHQS